MPLSPLFQKMKSVLHVVLAICILIKHFFFQRKTSSEHVYSAYPIKRPPRKSLPVTPPDSPEPLGAEALPPLPSSNQGASSGSSEKEDIFESQSSLMDTLRNSGNLQNASAGLRESLIFANQNSSTSDEDVCNSFPEDGVCRSIPDDMGTEGDIDSDPEYSEAAWIIDDHHHLKQPHKGLFCVRFSEGSLFSLDWCRIALVLPSR